MKHPYSKILGVHILIVTTFVLASLVTTPAVSNTTPITNKTTERQIPIIVTVDVNAPTEKTEPAIPLTITISNGLLLPIYHSTFSLIPNEWNGETFDISVVDVYRGDDPNNLFDLTPELKVPNNISGFRAIEIKSGGKLIIRTDAQKWKIRGGWFPGRYKIVVRVDKIQVDKYSVVSVLADPVEFSIK